MHGYTKLLVLLGGLDAWKAKGYPMETGQPKAGS